MREFLFGKEEKGIQWRQRERRNPMFSIALDPVLEEQVKEAAKEKGLCVSEYVCRLIQEKMEDEYDLRVYEEAKRQYEADPVTYTAKELGL